MSHEGFGTSSRVETGGSKTAKDEGEGRDSQRVICVSVKFDCQRQKQKQREVGINIVCLEPEDILLQVQTMYAYAATQSGEHQALAATH